MKVVPFRDADPSGWNAVWTQSPDAWLFHSLRWIHIEGDNFWSANLSIALEERGETAATLPLYMGIIGDQRVVLSGLHRHAGLAVHPDYHGQRKTIQAMVIDYARQMARRHEADRIQLSVQNLAPRSLSCQRDHIPFWVMDYGFHHGLACVPNGFEVDGDRNHVFADLIVDLRPSEAEIHANFSPACRRALTQAAANNLSFSVSTDADATLRFRDVARVSAERTGERLPPDSYYQSLQDLVYEGKLVLTQVLVGDAVSAASLIAVDKRAATYLAGASLAEYHPLRVNDFLHWQNALWLKQRDLDHYRLGPTFPQVPKDWPINRVAAFKERFGGRPFPIIQGFESAPYG